MSAKNLLKSDDAGSAKASTIDNRALGALLTYSLGGHKFGAGWQRMNGADQFFTDG